MSYTLKVTETGNKAAKFHYQVINDETGEVVSQRKSNNDYVACTINGQFYFGRLNLIGKGEHGNQLKFENGFRWVRVRGKNKMQFDATAEKIEHTPIAYKK